MKKILLYLSVLIASVSLYAQPPVITETGGWLESAFLKWEPLLGADSYNVYYTGGGQTDKKIDTQLIRSYGTYFRADVLGLAAGTYNFKVVAVNAGGNEGTSTTTGDITVLPHDRTGFAHHGGRIPGAYNLDGTLKNNAVVLYITQNNKNTISLNVTGANANPCVGLQTILDGFKKGGDTRPLAVRLIGNITDLNYMLSGDIVIENKNNTASSITFEGVGSDAVANGWGIRVKTATNIEIRNLGFMLTNAAEGDNIGLQQDNSYIWVHNNDLFYGASGGDADQEKGDGAMDCKKSTYVTFSYNHFWDSGKSNLLGLSEGTTAGLFITYHHNWYDHSDSRHPRVRYYSAHVYNNYYDGNSKYGAGSTLGSSVFMEGNFFRNCKYPMLTSKQGTDIYGGATGTFSGEPGGTIKAFNNIMSGQTRYMPYNATTNPIEFDAIEAATRNEIISSLIKSKLGANIYNNFDTDVALYVKNLIIDEPAVAKDKVMQYAGRVSGGDLKWTFNNAVDDTSYAINTGLKSALTSYTSNLLYVQGETPVIPNTQTLVSTDNNDQTIVEGNAIAPIIYTWGGDATDVTVSVLPVSGISFVKDAGAKTITVSGTPTANVSFSVTTSGTSGTPLTLIGNITVVPFGTVPGDEIHNYTLSGKVSTFFTITGSLSTAYGTASYDGLTLTQCLKMESTTNISFTTTTASTITLVFGSSYTGKVKIDATTYTPVLGIVTAPLTPGAHTILKVDTNYLFYMKIVYEATLGVEDLKGPKMSMYPNPVTSSLNIATIANIEKVEIYSMMGVLVKTIKTNAESIELSYLRPGTYVFKVYTDQGVSSKIVFKK
jgi:pectate lyase